MSEIADTDSGLFRVMSSKPMIITVGILWTLLSGLSVTLWLDMRDIQKSVTTLQAQQKNNDEMREQLWEAMKEMRADIKELLREVRK
jgi:hypothetical protein